MKKLALLISLTALIVSCVRLPDIMPNANHVRNDAIQTCNHLFSKGRWQLTHTIEAIVPGGKKIGLVGASVVSPHERTIQCALMTVEGFVLFSGCYDEKLAIERAVSPFDRPGFAEGLINDLRLLFLKPKASRIKTGFVDGMHVCRFMSSTEGAIDILFGNDQTWKVHKYSLNHKLERTIEARGQMLTDETDGTFFAKKMTLKRHGILGYQLNLQLVEAIPLP